MDYYHCSPSETSLSSLITLINNIAGLETPDSGCSSGIAHHPDSLTTADSGSGSVDQEDRTTASASAPVRIFIPAHPHLPTTSGITAPSPAAGITPQAAASAVAATTTSGKTIPRAPHLKPHDSVSNRQQQHHLLISKTTSTSVPSSSFTTSASTPSSSITSATTTTSTTTSAAGSSIRVNRCVTSSSCCCSSSCCHSGTCVPSAIASAGTHKCHQVIDLPHDMTKMMITDDFGIGDAFLVVDEEEDGGAGPASLLITPAAAAPVLKSCLITSSPAPNHPVLQRQSSFSSCPSSSGDGIPAIPSNMNGNCSNSRTNSTLWSKGGSGAAAVTPSSASQVTVTTMTSASSHAASVDGRKKKSHVFLISDNCSSRSSPATNQFIITSSCSSSSSFSNTAPAAAATNGLAVTVTMTESGQQQAKLSPAAVSGISGNSGNCLSRFASDESLPSDSGCGSSIGKASANSLSTGSNRSSICTVEDQPSASSSSTSSSTGSTSSSLSASSSGSTTGSHSSSPSSTCTSSSTTGPASSGASYPIHRRSLRSPYVGQAVALMDCTPCPYDKDALAFRKGDIVNIIAKNDTGTWIGTCNGKIGHFKFISVEEMSSRGKTAVHRTCNNNGSSSSIRPLTVVTSNNSPSSHVVHANETDSPLLSSFHSSSTSTPSSSFCRSAVNHSLHRKSSVTESGPATKSETMITGFRRRGSSSSGISVCGKQKEKTEDPACRSGQRRVSENNSDSLQSSSSPSLVPGAAMNTTTTTKSIEDPNGNCFHVRRLQDQKEKCIRGTADDHNDPDNPDDMDHGRNSPVTAGGGISGGEQRQFSRMRGFLITKKQQLQLQLQLQQQKQFPPETSDRRLERIPKSAPPTPSGAREPVPEPASSAGDEFAKWFTRKLNFFTSSSSSGKGKQNSSTWYSSGTTMADGISSGNNKSLRRGSRDDLLDDSSSHRNSESPAAGTRPQNTTATRRRLSSSVSMCSFHPTSSSTSTTSSTTPSSTTAGNEKTATTSKYSKLRAKSKSFFRKEPRATSADTRANLNKRHSSHEPLYGNGSGHSCSAKDQHREQQHYSEYGIMMLDTDVEAAYSGGHRPLVRSQSKFLDSDYLMEEITHTYEPNPQRRKSVSTSKISKYSSRSVFDLRNSSSHANGIECGGGESGNSVLSYQGKTASPSSSSEAAASASTTTTLEGKSKRMAPLRKLLSYDSSAKMRSQSSIGVPRSLPLDACTGRNSASNFRFPSPGVSNNSNNEASLHHLTLTSERGSIPTTPATTSASCKPIPKSLLDSLTQRLREESIDLTTDPYSDVGGFCGIPAALVQRYAEESAGDVYDVADALDHLRLESLLMMGRRGIPNDFLGDWCSGVTLAETMCLQDLHKWLISIGLTMYEHILVRNGWSHIDLIPSMKEADLEMMGIRRKSHQRIFINAIEAMKMNH